MVFCPQCESRLETGDTATYRSECPKCGEVFEADNSIAWSDVVRVANLAEAGFIADELSGMNIDARIRQIDEFSAARDRWSSQYLIQVPVDLAHAAADHVRQYLSEEPPGRPSMLDTFRAAAHGGPAEQVSWRPVVVVLIAGVVGFTVGQRFPEQKAPQRTSPNALSDAVGAIGRPLVSAPVVNQPRFRLSFDRRQQQWTLDTDRDNDGVFESTRRFNAAGDFR